MVGGGPEQSGCKVRLPWRGLHSPWCVAGTPVGVRGFIGVCSGGVASLNHRLPAVNPSGSMGCGDSLVDECEHLSSIQFDAKIYLSALKS